jgi:tetratricopeptide (TPR) repeat protein
VFELNVDRFPDEANPYDGLVEACLARGDRERAITLYRKALEVDPEFDNARRMLAQLKADD